MDARLRDSNDLKWNVQETTKKRCYRTAQRPLKQTTLNKKWVKGKQAAWIIVMYNEKNSRARISCLLAFHTKGPIFPKNRLQKPTYEVRRSRTTHRFLVWLCSKNYPHDTSELEKLDDATHSFFVPTIIGLELLIRLVQSKFELFSWCCERLCLDFSRYVLRRLVFKKRKIGRLAMCRAGVKKWNDTHTDTQIYSLSSVKRRNSPSRRTALDGSCLTAFFTKILSF